MRVKLILTWLAAVMLTMAVTGCNTIKGVGTDITEIAQHSQNMVEGVYDNAFGPISSAEP